MASLFDQPVLGGLFGDIEGPQRQGLNMGLLGLGLGLLETGKFGPGLRNFQSLYQSGLQSGNAAEDRERKKEEEKRRQAATDKMRGLALGGHMGGEGPSPGSIRAGQEVGMIQPGMFQENDPRRQVVSSLFDYDPDQAVSLVTDAAFPKAGSPGDRYRVVGNDIIDISGEQPRIAFSGRGGGGRGGVTLTQEANNAEIDAARSYIAEQGFTYEDIVRATQPTTPDGWPNPDYNQLLAAQFRTATQRKVGDDPGFSTFRQRYFPTGQAQPEQPQGTMAQASMTPAAASGEPLDVPMVAGPEGGGMVDPSQLVVGQPYRIPGTAEVYQWDGKQFVPIQ